MKRMIITTAALLFVGTASPASAHLTVAGAIPSGHAMQISQSVPLERAPLGNFEIPLIGLAVSGLLYGAGRVWGR